MGPRRRVSPAGETSTGRGAMGEDAVPYGRVTQRAPAVAEVHVLWLTAGLSCDGDSVSITAATQPSLEDIVLGAIPGLPRVHLHHPVLAYETGSAFLEAFHRAAQGKLGPFVLVVEVFIPNERVHQEGYWAAFGTDANSGQPIATCDWIDRLSAVRVRPERGPVSLLVDAHSG